MSPEYIRVRGARQHNLRDVNLDIPKNQITVITGPSGCGKSSLAFHTLYAEGQRRYLECLGVSAQKTLKVLDKAEFDYIDGLNPTIALQQDEERPVRGVTVGGATDIHDYFALLYSNIGVPYDPETGARLEKLTSEEIVSRLCDYPERTKVMLLAPLDRSFFSEISHLKDDLRRQGFVRVAIGSDLYDINDEWPKGGELAVVVDRLVIRDGAESRIADSLETALQIHDSGAKTLIQAPGEDSWSEISFTTSYHNPATGYILGRLEPSCFSYKSKHAQCATCQGSGRDLEDPCSVCNGERLTKDYLQVKLPFGGKHLSIVELTSMPVHQIIPLCDQLVIPEVLRGVVKEILSQIERRLSFLDEVGLGYIHLSQWANELSAGEYQRLRLASQMGGGLSGVLYVLDEPSRGLHDDDTELLIKALRKLQNLGNTIIIVEHDPQLMKSFDWVVELGPGAGVIGGEILFQGRSEEFLNSSSSPTGKWLSELNGEKTNLPNLSEEKPVLEIQNATLNNLDSLSVRFSVGAMTVVTGRSGVGKSSLVTKTLGAYAQFKLNGGKPYTPKAEITGLEQFSRSVVVDQTPIGRSPRSSPATYTGMFDEVRKLFTTVALSKQRGYQASRFSFNVKGGRCEKCLGSGKIKVPLQFLNDAYVTCDGCSGNRYNRETLEVRYKGKSIADILNNSISENYELFRKHPKLSLSLKSLLDVGLGYLKLGQGANTLSGGEAQRVKIATELLKALPDRNRVRKEATLYILDEPTRGLHFMDVDVLVRALRSLLIDDNTIIAIEHNTQFINHCDYEVPLG